MRTLQWLLILAVPGLGVAAQPADQVVPEGTAVCWTLPIAHHNGAGSDD